MACGAAPIRIGIVINDMNEVIEVNNLTKQFRARGNKNVFTGIIKPDWKYTTAVDAVSFSVKQGEAVAFLGPNGAGKTTTTKMMTGLIYPTSGQVQVLGYDPFKHHPKFLRRIGLVMGNKSGLNWDLTAEQSFWLLKNIYEIGEATFNKRLRHLAELLNVDSKLDTQVRRLSLGERMKLELIGSILHGPDILFLDEPTIGLDIESKKNVREFLRTIQRENGTTLILTSHDMDDIEEVCDRVLVINHGRIAYDNSLKDLVKSYNQSRYVRFHFKETFNSEKLKSYGEVVESKNGVLIKVPSEKLVHTLSDVPQKFSVEDINIESIPLETIINDIFKNGK